MIKLSSFLWGLSLIIGSTQLMSFHSENEVYLKEPVYKKPRIISDQSYTLKVETSRDAIFMNKKVLAREGDVSSFGDTMTQLLYWDHIKIHLIDLNHNFSRKLVGFSGAGKYPYIFDLKALLIEKVKSSSFDGLDVSSLSTGLEYDAQNQRLTVLPAELYTVRQDELSFKVN